MLKLIPFDDDLARNNYGEILETLEPLPDFTSLPPTLDPLFGRKDMQNVFLTSVGIIGCKRVLHALKCTVTDVKICVLLPRVAQLLLWFMKEHEVFQVLLVLLTESKEMQECEKFSYYFPMSLEKHREAAEVIIEMAGLEKSTLLRDLVKDIIYNLMVGYISPSFYPVVLMYFVVDGMGGMIRLIVSLMKLLAPHLRTLVSSDLPLNNFLLEAKNISKTNADIAEIMRV